MSYLKNTITGRVVGDILSDSDVYEFLKELTQTGTGPGTPLAPRPLYEEISLATLEHLIAGDDENKEVTVPPIGETGYQVFAKVVGSLGAAVDETFTLGTVEEGGNVTSVEYIPYAAVIGEATNYRTLSVIDAGSEGAAGSPATVASLALSSAAVTLVADEPNSLTAGTVAVLAGDVLEYKSVHAGTGLADPGGLIIVTVNGYSYSSPDYSNAGYSDPDEGGEG